MWSCVCSLRAFIDSFGHCHLIEKCLSISFYLVFLFMLCSECRLIIRVKKWWHSWPEIQLLLWGKLVSCLGLSCSLHSIDFIWKRWYTVLSKRRASSCENVGTRRGGEGSPSHDSSLSEGNEKYQLQTRWEITGLELVACRMASQAY